MLVRVLICIAVAVAALLAVNSFDSRYGRRRGRTETRIEKSEAGAANQEAGEAD